jgi:hypothetical protein
MSKFRSIPYAVLAGSLLVGGSAYAQSMYGIDQRQDYQQNRIEQGIRSGQITESEAYRLRQGELAIDRAQARARADGTVTQQERNRIDNMADRQGRQIYRQGHDRQQAWDRGQDWGRTDGRRDGWNDRYAGGRNNGGWDRGNGGWDRGHQMQNNQTQRVYNARHNERTQPTAPARQPSANNGGWRMQQASMPPQAPRQQQPQRSWGGGGGGFRMQQASAPAPRQASAPTAPRPTYTASSGGQRSRGR